MIMVSLQPASCSDEQQPRTAVDETVVPGKRPNHIFLPLVRSQPAHEEEVLPPILESLQHRRTRRLLRQPIELEQERKTAWINVTSRGQLGTVVRGDSQRHVHQAAKLTRLARASCKSR